MEEFEKDGKSIGIVIDVSLRHDRTGRRVVDAVKKGFLGIIREFVADGVDVLYLFHPQLLECLEWNGDQNSAISNYETDGWHFDTSYALKQTLFVLEAQDPTSRKYLFYVTDRCQSEEPFQKALFLNQRDLIGVHFVLIGIGDKYDREVFKIVKDLGANDVSVIHLDDSVSFNSSVLKDLDNVQNLQGSSNERDKCI